MLSCLKEDGIEPARFIGLHAVAACIDQTESFSPSAFAQKAKSQIFEIAKDVLDEETYEQLNAWVQWPEIYDGLLLQACNWSKIGAMYGSLNFLNRWIQIGGNNPGIIKNCIDGDDGIESSMNDCLAVFEDCKGTFSALDRLFQENLDSLQDQIAYVRFNLKSAPIASNPVPSPV